MKQRDQARIEAAKLNPTKFSRYGVPDGMRRAEATLAWAQANELADRFIAALKRIGEIPENNYAVVSRDGRTILAPATDAGLAEGGATGSLRARSGTIDAAGEGTSCQHRADIHQEQAREESQAEAREAEDFLAEILNIDG